MFEIGLTPNRTDSMSHMGVARDLKALCQFKGIPFKWSIPRVEKLKIKNKTKLNFLKDENIISGFIIKLGSKMLDCSIKSKLDKIRDSIR